VGGGSAGSELLEVHISKRREHPLTGINRGFGQLGDLAAFALVEIEGKQLLYVIGSHGSPSLCLHEVGDRQRIAVFENRPLQVIRLMLTGFYLGSHVFEALQVLEAPEASAV
jgi:hypothetical protein